jgi:hypothetical protein
MAIGLLSTDQLIFRQGRIIGQIGVDMGAASQKSRLPCLNVATIGRGRFCRNGLGNTNRQD